MRGLHIREPFSLVASFLCYLVFSTGHSGIASAEANFHPHSPEHARLCFERVCFDAEVARSSQERQDGLMFRTALDEGKGMLFVFEKAGNYRIWMKNMKFPLDILWLRKDLSLMDYRQNLPPCQDSFCPTYQPEGEALYVLEVSAGTVKRLGLQKGDKLEFVQDTPPQL